jgi:ribosomal protein L6P/L9E
MTRKIQLLSGKLVPGKTEVRMNCEFSLSQGIVRLKNQKGESALSFKNKHVRLQTTEWGFRLVPLSLTREHWAILCTTRRRLENMRCDLENGVESRLVYSYNSFCISLDITSSSVRVSNYLGSKRDYTIERVPGVSIVKSDEVNLVLGGFSRQTVGVMISRLTGLRRKSGFALKLDKRKFFDNYYLDRT